MTAPAAAAFRSAAEAKDVHRMLSAMSDDVVLHSPVSHQPFTSRTEIEFVLGVLADSFVDFRYTDQLDGDGVTALVFRTSVDGRELEGLDLLRFGADGLVADLTVMMRPKTALEAVLRRVGRALEDAAG